MIFLFPRWDMWIPWRVSSNGPFLWIANLGFPWNPWPKPETRLENRRAGLRGDKPWPEERRRCGCRVEKEMFLSAWNTDGGFLKWWYPTTMDFPTKNDHFGVFWGYPYLWKHPDHDTTFRTKHDHRKITILNRRYVFKWVVASHCKGYFSGV